MKKTFRISLGIVLAAVVSVASLAVFAAGNDKGSMKFEETTHDFGNVKEDGGAVTCEFPFVNDGKANLVVISATAECGCTKPSFPKQPVAPGKSGKITVTYNPIGRPGAFSKVITVKTNGKPSKVRLKIRGSVIPKR